MATIAELQDIVVRIGVAQENLAKTMDRMSERVDRTTESVDRMSKRVDRVTRNVGGLNGSIGEIIQMIVLPGIMEKMNTLGHNFTMAAAEKDYYKKDGNRLTEVDLLLENSQDVMVVEVKTKVSLARVQWHLKRLELLRKNEAITGMTGKTMYAAIAGFDFDTDARDLVAENGIYMVEIEEDEDRINITPPPSGKAGTW